MHSSDNRNGHAFNGHAHSSHGEEEGYEEEVDDNSTVLTDEIDHQILMHRDAHFGGDFRVMLTYYENEDHIGLNPEFDIERIAYLAEVEKEMGQDLSPLILTGAEAEAVGRSRLAYSRLKEIYENEEESSEDPRLIADLILTEEEEPTAEIEAVVAQGTDIVPDLLSVLKADEFYDPLFPGYGYAPYMAALCLGKIKDPRAIVPLFETLSRDLIFDEMVLVDALAEIGSSAQEFLLKIVKSRPLTQDNANAAFALIAFSQEEEVAIASLEQLKDPAVQETPLLRTYLLCCCEILGETAYKESFIDLAKNPQTLPELRKEMERMAAEWE